MKECPICHAMNGNRSETCYNCHTPFNFSTKDEEEQRNNDNNKCAHCGAEINNINVSDTDNDISHSQLKTKLLLCNKCKTKKFFLSLLFFIIAIILGFIAALLLNGFLNIILGPRTRYGVGGALIPAFLVIAYGKVNSIFKKPKKEKQNKETIIKQKEVKKKYCKQKKVKEKYCKHCGGLIDNKTKKCTSCNKQYFHPIRHINNILNKLESKQAKYCKKCGGSIDENTRKCSNCGKQYFKFCFNKKAAIITISVISVALVSLVVLFLTTFKVYSDDLVIISSSAYRGNTAYASIHAEPYTKYNITVTYADGSKENIGAAQRETGIAGEVTWQWYVSNYTSPGECKIRIESDREYNTETIHIY